MSAPSRAASHRLLAVLLVLAQLLLGCPPANPPLDPAVGSVERREPNWVYVPGGVVDVAGGKLVVSRVDLVLDTRLGRELLGAVYDSAAGAWRWSFESRYDGASFVDESGARFEVGALADGTPLPGTWWVKLDATRIRTRGGLVSEYGMGGLLAARYWASDPYPRIVLAPDSIAGALRIARIEQCTAPASCTPLFTLGYDGAGRIVSVLDRAGRRAEYDWDTAGRLVAARDALDVAEGWPGFRYAYFGKKLIALTNSEGERIEYAWAGARLASVTQVGPGSPVIRFAYEGRDAAGLYHTRVWSPLDEERRYAYDGLGRLAEQLEVAGGERTRFTWSDERPTSRRTADGALTTWLWSGEDVVERRDPSGNVVCFAYRTDAVDREDPRRSPIAEVVDSLGPVEARDYDGAGRLVEQRNGEGEAASFTWSEGMLASVTRGGVTRSYLGYGEHGHATQIRVLGQTELRSFDAVGNLLTGSDGLSPVAGGIVRRGFDADRNLARLELAPDDPYAATSVVELSSRSDGQQTRVVRGGDDHEFGYDAFGRLVERRERADGAWHATRFGYDAAGRPLWLERPNGMREEVAYGPGDRVASLRSLRDGAVETETQLFYENGLLVRVEDSASGTERYVHDAAGRRVETTFAGGERLALELDLRSRTSAEHFVSAAGFEVGTLRYGHDRADRQIEIADAGGPLWNASFEEGRLQEVRTGNGLARRFTYAGGALVGAETLDAAGRVVESTTLDRSVVADVDGFYRLRQRATTATHGAVEVTTIEEYELAPAPGLHFGAGGARVASWHDGLSASEPYVFDAQSNLRAMGATQLHYNAEGNRLLGLEREGRSVGRYAWDGAGFATERNGVPLAWSAAGRLVAHGADTLAWDGLGRLREAVIGGEALAFGFGGRVQLDAGGVPLGVDLGALWVGFGGAHLYRHLDFRGNVKFVSDDAGEVVAHYRYAPFGLDAVFGTDGDRVRFAARPEIGELMLLGARVYDPSVGRFLSPDPLFQIVNQFAYTLGNPVWFSDPEGTSAEANASASGVDSLAATLSLIAAALGTLGALLRFAPVPQLVVLGAVLGLAAALLGLLVALMLVFGKSGDAEEAAASASAAQAAAGGGSIGGVGGGGGGGAGGGGSTTGGCTPAGLAALPNLSGWLRVLLPLQLLLGLCLLRRRREEERA